MRKKILKITRFYLIYIIFIMILCIFMYKEKIDKEYTYVINNSQGKSNNCYVNNYDFRICEVKNKILKVDYYYE